MIRINLLNAERKAAKPSRGAAFQSGQKMVIGCSAILIASVLFVGWRYWSLDQQSKKLDQDISDSQQETARLRGLIQQVQQFEQQKAQLQQRVVLIEQLRKGQTGPVHMLDQISRALPPMLWLTELKQNDEGVVIDGRCTAVTNLTDFVSNLEASGYFRKSIDIVSSQSETVAAASGEMIKFSIRAQFQQPGEQAKKSP
jgi:type IV pilus assembly protein PilN